KRLVGGSPDGGLQVWDVPRARPLPALAGPGGRVRGVAFAPAGNLLAVARVGSGVRLVNTATGRVVHTLSVPNGGAHSLLFSADGSVLVTAGGGVVRLWDVREGKPLDAIAEHPDAEVLVAFSPDGKSLVLTGKEVRRWALAARRTTDWAETPGLVWLSPDCRVV